MVFKSQEEKENAVISRLEEYLRQGFRKSAAVRRVMEDFSYSTETSIYLIQKRVNKRKGQ